ncbi:MAG: hypothetical protein KJ804_19230 [Proteobacteria bacterium]|nr:hypothetical protein [Pseudomonadota bacterium]MBU1060443.1 hypothetical protein [Pseudomonadota bacterium]
MPNTLAHIGIQTPLTGLLTKEVPLQWIVMGCIIPDIPWIVQRIFHTIAEVDPVALHLYATTQASLAYCLILSLAVAMLSRDSKKIFLVLAMNSLFHLLLDATQIKWGNGVNLLVPFSWETLHFNLFWPEHFSSYLLTGLGLLILLLQWRKAIHCDLHLQRPNPAKTLCLSTCLLLYFFSPPLLIDRAYEADTHYSKTLSSAKTRTGKTVALDRATYSAGDHTLRSYSDQRFKVANPPPLNSSIVSIRGHFLDGETLELSEYHFHRPYRDPASYAGLLLALLFWMHSLVQHPPFKTSSRSSQ